MKPAFKKWFGILLLAALVTGLTGAGLGMAAPIEKRTPEIGVSEDAKTMSLTIGAGRCAIDIPDYIALIKARR